MTTRQTTISTIIVVKTRPESQFGDVELSFNEFTFVFHKTLITGKLSFSYLWVTSGESFSHKIDRPAPFEDWIDAADWAVKSAAPQVHQLVREREASDNGPSMAVYPWPSWGVAND